MEVLQERGTVRFSLLVHFGLYVAMLSAPSPLLRNLTFLTSRLYSTGLLYVILANFIQVGIAYRNFGGNETVDEADGVGDTHRRYIGVRGVRAGGVQVCAQVAQADVLRASDISSVRGDVLVERGEVREGP